MRSCPTSYCDIMRGAAVGYEQVGMKLVLWPEMVTRGFEARRDCRKVGECSRRCFIPVCDYKARVRGQKRQLEVWRGGGECVVSRGACELECD